jgi:outer membrane receptor protein involved in Fe transport
MRKLITLALLVTAASFTTNAQTNGRIRGTVKDEEGKALQSATVSLLRSADSSLVKAAVSDKAGTYEFTNIKGGKYLVSYTSTGYEKKFSRAFELADNTIDLSTVSLSAVAKGLTGVTVQSKKPFIETKLDKTIVNVEASPTNAGATALEVLEKSPGISVNSDGVISLRGKAGVIVMLDGKPTYLSATDLANMLKNMPASALETIEIMTNPSAKFDASGNSGVINIRTKKGRAPGLNGSVMAGITTSIYQLDGNTYVLPKSQNSFQFNYKKNKLNFFGNYNPNYHQGRNTMVLDRKFNDNGVYEGYSAQTTHFKFRGHNHTLKLGVDWDASKKDVLGVVVSGFMFNGNPTPVTSSELFDANNQLESKLISFTDNDISFRNFTSNINWCHKFDSTGKELSADLDYVRYDNVNETFLTTDIYNNNGQLSGQSLLKGELPADINIYSFKSDYTKPFKGGRFEAGVKVSYVKNDNLVNYKTFFDNKWYDDARSNHFIYEENINAAYVNFTKQVKKWNFQGGLRVENTSAKGDQVTTRQQFKRDTTNLFPTAYVSYAIDKNNTLTVNYGRRINRPSYQNLNPFTYFLDTLTYMQGNTRLRPEYTDKYELSYAYKSKYILSASYSETDDVISQIIKQNTSERKTFVTPDNVATFRNVGVSLTAPFKLAKWWNANFFTNVYNNHFIGVIENAEVDIDYTSFMANVTNTFTLGKGFTAEISGFYRHKDVNQLAIVEPLYQMSIGGQKQVLQGKGTIRLNFRDPFAWQKFEGLNKYGNIDMRFTNRPDTRQISASFSYRFGKSTPQSQPRRRASSSQDEQNRVGQGS